LDSLERDPLTPYKPKDEKDSDQFHKFIFESGRIRENEKLINLLKGI
jgi:hypothetical protein